MKLLTKEQQELFENPKICYICKETFEEKYIKDKRYNEIRIIIEENKEVLHIVCVI